MVFAHEVASGFLAVASKSVELQCVCQSLSGSRKSHDITGRYDGGIVVSRSIEIGEPIIFVSMNYR